ncbi:MAG: FeoA domain-containing protein [Planctomycetota bacterium]|nr:FeoA domain-containing protein [Planctomycetota bacterium]
MGVLTFFRNMRRQRRRVLFEDALKHLHACERQGRVATTDSLAGVLRRAPRHVIELCRRMQARGWVKLTDDGLRLTPEGEQLALQVIRAHRLWERYLADEARLPLEKLHTVADRREHQRDAGALDAMDAALGHPLTDPHGDPIPSAEGTLPPRVSRRLTEWPVGRPATIVHLEDEPPAVFSQIIAEGLRPGQRIRIIDADETRLVLTDETDTFILAPVVAGNIFIVPAEPAIEEEAIRPLTTLKKGQSAIVHGLDDSLQGYTRRRLLDLGLTPGAEINASYSAFLGDPMAFRVRGSLVALRRDQARHVLIRANGATEGDGHG